MKGDPNLRGHPEKFNIGFFSQILFGSPNICWEVRKKGWEEALERGVMDSFEIPPAPLDDLVEDERGWEEALDRDLMDRFVNPPAHLSEHDL